MIYYTYILQSERDGRFYIGQTQDLEQRLLDHNSGQSNYTKRFTPWRLIWYAEYKTRKEAYSTEQQLKKKKSRTAIIQFISKNQINPGSENLQISDLLDFREST